CASSDLRTFRLPPAVLERKIHRLTCPELYLPSQNRFFSQVVIGSRQLKEDPMSVSRRGFLQCLGGDRGSHASAFIAARGHEEEVAFAQQGQTAQRPAP